MREHSGGKGILPLCMMNVAMEAARFFLLPFGEKEET
jgi:hypothetical protein